MVILRSGYKSFSFQIIRDTLAQVAQPSTSTVADAEVCQTEGEVPMQEQIWDDSVGGSNQLTFENFSIDLVCCLSYALLN